LQVIKAKHYEQLLGNLHISQSLLKADRGHIFTYDKSGQPVQLTENIMMYNVFAEPQFIGNKERFIELITPLVYKHLCQINGMHNVGKEECIWNIEAFSNKDLLPQEPQFFYYGSGKKSEWIDDFNWTWFYKQKAEIIDNFTTWTAYGLIENRLDKRIFIGIKPSNYLGFFANRSFLDALQESDFDFIDIQSNYYIYIVPSKVDDPEDDFLAFKKLLDQYGYFDSFPNLEFKFYPQENKYVKIISDVSPDIAQMVRNMKNEYYRERTRGNIPILHGLWLESSIRRYYTYGSFLANVLGYVDKHDDSYYGIEQYFDELLAGKDGEIKWRASAWIGQVWANEFEIKDVEHGDDVYLTIDIGMQREIEMIAQRFHKYLKADSVSVLVYDPYNGHIKASVNAPGYDPNDYNAAYEYQSLSPEYWYLVDDVTYYDVPVYYKTWGEYRLTTTDVRIDTGVQKYIKKNIYWSQVFVDKNISMAYEPWSIFKPLTVAIGLDIDEVRFYDFYNDPGFVKIGPYTIKNADDECEGDHSFLHAMVFSCNVGMVRIAQKIGKESFYNYITKLWFGQPTHIELANEDEGDVWSVASVSKARYFNNTFGQGFTATPLQVAAGYSALINGGYYVKPTIIAGVLDKQTWEYFSNKKEIVSQIFREEISEMMKEWLYKVMETNPWYIKYIKVDGYTLWWKSWTSQISYKGRYQDGLWWTNGSFVGIVSKDDLKYVVVIQVRRPRTVVWWSQTAGKVFRDVAKFLVKYSLVEK